MIVYERKQFLKAAHRRGVSVKDGDIFMTDHSKKWTDPTRISGPLPLSREEAEEEARRGNELYKQGSSNTGFRKENPFEVTVFLDPAPDIGEYVLWGGDRGIGRIGRVTQVIPQGKFEMPKVRVIWVFDESGGPIDVKPGDKGRLISHNFHRLPRSFLQEIAK